MLQGRPIDVLARQVTALNRVMPVKLLGELGSHDQQYAARVAQLVQGQEYQGRVVAKVSEQTFLVNLSGKQFQDLPIKMQLGQQAKVGQGLTLEFLTAQPALTFALKTAATPPESAQVRLSHTATQIGQYLHQAEAQGTPKRFQAVDVVTYFPSKPQHIAVGLKQALEHSGLFYESHLQALSQGKLSLAEIKQEPQNLPGFKPDQHVYQQLHIHEHQRLSWHGEVWPGQLMTWDVYTLPEHGQQENTSSANADNTPVASELALELPMLGQVKVKLMVVAGHLRVHLSGQEANTVYLLQQEKRTLADALTQRGQTLDALTVAYHEPTATHP